MRWLYASLDVRAFRSSYAFEFAEFCLLIALSFGIPLIMGHPQVYVGTLVNTFLVISALNLGARQVIFLSLIPSVSALLRGVLFGPFTPALAFMLPFIWVGNIILILAIKALFIEKKINYAVSLFIGALAKSSFLFASALALFNFGFVPALFLSAMGVMQFATALAGGVLAYFIWKVVERFVGFKIKG
ncbi:MAG: hypothetical protein QXP42_01655 [Candidatus Micrarchaeia archaeon]